MFLQVYWLSPAYHRPVTLKSREHTSKQTSGSGGCVLLLTWLRCFQVRTCLWMRCRKGRYPPEPELRNLSGSPGAGWRSELGVVWDDPGETCFRWHIWPLQVHRHIHSHLPAQIWEATKGGTRTRLQVRNVRRGSPAEPADTAKQLGDAPSVQNWEFWMWRVLKAGSSKRSVLLYNLLDLFNYADTRSFQNWWFHSFIKDSCS